MKFSAVLLFALGAVAAVIPEESPVETREVDGEAELMAREEVVEVLVGRQSCTLISCPAAVRIQSASCRCSQRSPCSLYACEGGRRAWCGSGITRCVRA
ncbi:hypothetical protein RB595_008755 [Gaeumannomyces hyphopodioides]